MKLLTNFNLKFNKYSKKYFYNLKKLLYLKKWTFGLKKNLILIMFSTLC